MSTYNSEAIALLIISVHLPRVDNKFSISSYVTWVRLKSIRTIAILG